MAILVIGLIGNPSAFSNFNSKTQHDSVKLDFTSSSSSGLAFAENENDTGDENKTKNEDQTDGSENENQDENESEDKNQAIDESENEDQAKEDKKQEESGKVTICHVPSGNPDKAHTITVNRAALEKHLAHGDFVGECKDGLDTKLKEREAKLAEKAAEREEKFAEKQAEREARLAENATEHESRLAEKHDKALKRADEITQRLEERIAQLEKRVQTLLDMLESGKYFGRTIGQNTVTKSYSISFNGTASSIFDESVTSDISGQIFLENLPTGAKVSKFRATGGEITVGENIYDLAFGKARVSSGQSGEGSSMVLIGELIDIEGNQNTLKLTLDFADSLEGDFGSEPIGFDILPQSKISREWSISAQGQLSQVES